MVAAIEVPANHHGRERPDTKKDSRPFSARDLNHRAMPRAVRKYRPRTVQSLEFKYIQGAYYR